VCQIERLPFNGWCSRLSTRVTPGSRVFILHARTISIDPDYQNALLRQNPIHSSGVLIFDARGRESNCVKDIPAERFTIALKALVLA
jgi:hypothetical protein